MYMNLSPIKFHNTTTHISTKQKNARYSNLVPLAYDTISFGAMKKKEFSGIDLAVIQKFSAPIEKFNSNEDLQNWADEKVQEILNKDFGGRSEETKIQRKAMLKEWSDYVLDENDAYKKTTAFLILSAITKDLHEDNDNIPPVLNKGVLADCISEIEKNIKTNPKYQFDLNKMYKNKLRTFYLDDVETNTGETATKWVVIPSKEHDSKNFKANVEKLKVLSYKTWCTKSFNAEPYLEDGDFHIYLENGKPKLGVRFVGDEIEEIQGEKNNGEIPLGYLDTLKRYILENNFKLTENANDEIEFAQEAKEEIEKIKNDLSEAIRNNDVKAIYEYFEISVQEDKDGYLTISKYEPPPYCTFEDLGIDENKLLEKVRIIKHCAYFRDSQATSLTNLETIGAEADFTDSKISDLRNLKSIGANAFFSFSKITDLPSLESIGVDANFAFSKITDLPSLEVIGGSVGFRDSLVANIGKLKCIGGIAYIENSPLVVEDFNNVEVRGIVA